MQVINHYKNHTKQQRKENIKLFIWMSLFIAFVAYLIIMVAVSDPCAVYYNVNCL